MEKSKSKKIKTNTQNQLVNQYSYVNGQEYRDRFNMFSLDLQKMKKKNRVLPELSLSKRSAMENIQQKLRLLKLKIKAKQLQNLQSERQKFDNSQNIMPFPMAYSMPYPMQYSYPYPNCHMGQCNHCPYCVQQKPKKKRRNKKPKKQQPKPIKKFKNKFRICAYAVYFSIFIKYYSQKFTENRKKWFYDRYSKKEKGIIYEGSEKVLQKFHQLDFYQMSKDAKVTKHISGQTMIDWQEYTNTALIPHQDTQRTAKGKDTVSQYIINFMEALLEKISELLLNQDFISEYHQVFSAGSLDMSYILDNLYLPQQIPFLYVHPSKGYLRMGYQQQIQLLLMKVMIKMVIYNFLFGVGKSKSWSSKVEKEYKLAHFQLQQLWEIARTLGIYLYMVCKDIYVLGIKNLSHVSNFYQVSKKFGVKQAKKLQQFFGQRNISDSEEKTEKQFQLIKNIKNLQITKQKITRNHRLMQYKQVLKQKTVQLLTNLHQKIKKQQRQLYLYVKNMTLAVPYLILQSINKKSQKQQKKSKHHRILRPQNQDKNNRQWHKIYGGQNSSNTNNNSFDLQRKSNKQKNNVKFDDSFSKMNENSILKTNSSLAKKTMMINDGNGLKQMTNREVSFESNQSNMKNNKYLQVPKSYEMKKAFNYDSVNAKYGQNRQDRLRQKFRNILVKNNNNQVPQQT